ncbi:triose-phosphate isomerase [Haemophilus haemolyticus]|uniref:triose-phosphate isomerase n=1 Tax=Haemophilus haemolyticus TaxID=726 RepID=UPI000E0CED42|nr:triose-phosphate isomerase [Haemophilus haemolyticus]
MARRPLVMGNWKLNGSKAFTKELIEGLKAELHDVTGCDVAIAPPVMYLDVAEAALSTCCCCCNGGKNVIQLGAQNVDVNVKGAFTGDISTEMLKDFGAKYIIIGHSERRTYHKESDEFVAKKFGALKEAGLVPVLCIGETEAENEAGKTEEVCARQIDAVINTLGVEAFNGAVIAYEPIWAIGTGKSATPAQAQAVHAFIRGHIAAKSQAVADQVIIQYGGSVNDANAAELFTQPDIDGALVGGASLKAPAFAVIVKAAAAAKN